MDCYLTPSAQQWVRQYILSITDRRWLLTQSFSTINLLLPVDVASWLTTPLLESLWVVVSFFRFPLFGIAYQSVLAIAT
jgi:hypothetical protein